MKEIKNGVLLFVVLSLLTGVLYPAAVTVLAQLIFPWQANGSILYGSDGRAIGSSLIGQPFSDPKYFWPRPSATTDFPYNALASGGSNLGPTNKELISQVGERVKTFRESAVQGPLPADLVTASGSGLDPHITPEAAMIQIPRIAKTRHLSEDVVKDLVQRHLDGRQLGLLGSPRVNVLKLNLALDAVSTG
ncbi:MAG TPA: potassium-transporting ATPase subunit KdpC [Thermodesulfovibrionales bacterium]|nr:potassium-transporting ATPase subunit KdpC [Thermodesulfovibrionales bacterium]